MFMFRSTHLAEVRRLEDKIASLEAQRTSEADSTVRFIDSLERQIQDLKRLIFIPKSNSDSPEILEADAVITGSDKPYEMSEEEYNKVFAANREADLLFSGNYDTDYDLQ